MSIAVSELTVEAGDHVVQFYDDEAHLVRTVASYVCGTIDRGDAALVIAAPGHLRAFEAEIAVRGVDLEQARRDGSLIALDALSTLELFSGDDGIDTEAFHRLIGAAVHGAAENGRAVRAYGEMVALLWQAGKVGAAIQLEELWNELSRTLPFSLLCAYSGDSVAGLEQADAFDHVCRLHSAAIGALEPVPELLSDFPATNESPAAARRWLGTMLREQGLEGTVLSDAAIVVTELATNAVVHAKSQFRVSLRFEHAMVHLAVDDRGPVVPMIGDTAELAQSGRGLALVGALTHEWGVQPTSAGKRIWARLVARA